MSVSVDTVYRTVLLILNKEQRGYMTPDEFNKIGSQVQREIFERYFEDINQQVRIQQTEYDYANRVYNTDEKIAEFKTTASATHTAGGVFELPSNLYRLGSLTYAPTNLYPVELQRLDELQAAFGLLKLKHIDKWTERYIEIAQFYSENITDKVVDFKLHVYKKIQNELKNLINI